jgi:hypothetical protein
MPNLQALADALVCNRFVKADVEAFVGCLQGEAQERLR